jgi:hypothetical protein
MNSISRNMVMAFDFSRSVRERVAPMRETARRDDYPTGSICRF